jgi:DNA-binding NarL/FixJ family response regulator
MAKDAAIRVLLVDYYELVRGMLNDLLGKEQDMQIVGLAGSSEEAVDLAQRVTADVVILDIEMPGLSEFEAARLINKDQPKANFLFLSAFAHDIYVSQALSVKAHGYLTKHEPPKRIVQAVRTVARGEMCFSKEIQSKLVIDGDEVRLADVGYSVIKILSPRELEVIRLIALGRSKKQIAGDLYISVSTVENHTANIMKNLGIHNRVELARLAFREKLLSL